IGAGQTRARSGKLMRKHHALARRLLERQDDYLRFTADFRAPPDNNGCERDIRMAKLRQKVSGCLRTMTGARQFCAIRSYLSTAAKQGLAFFDALVMLTEGQPWMPATPEHRRHPGQHGCRPASSGPGRLSSATQAPRTSREADRA